MNDTQSAVEEDGAVVVTDARVDPDRFMLEGIDTSKEPLYSVGEVGKVFFNRTSHWVRWVEREGKLVLDGKPVAQERSAAGSRKYTLWDVEQMAHALAQNEVINGAQLRLALALVSIQAELYGYK